MMRVTCSSKGFGDAGVTTSREIVPLKALRSKATIAESNLELEHSIMLLSNTQAGASLIKSISLLQTT